MEIYRSFEGKLDADNQRGYIVEKHDSFYEVIFYSIWGDEETGRVRLANAVDWADVEAVQTAGFEAENGTRDGQAFYRDKWYSTATINAIQRDRKDGEWRKYIK